MAAKLGIVGVSRGIELDMARFKTGPKMWRTIIQIRIG